MAGLQGWCTNSISDTSTTKSVLVFFFLPFVFEVSFHHCLAHFTVMKHFGFSPTRLQKLIHAHTCTNMTHGAKTGCFVNVCNVKTWTEAPTHDANKTFCIQEPSFLWQSCLHRQRAISHSAALLHSWMAIFSTLRTTGGKPNNQQFPPWKRSKKSSRSLNDFPVTVQEQTFSFFCTLNNNGSISGHFHADFGNINTVIEDKLGKNDKLSVFC